MPTIQISIDLDEEDYRAYETEAQREGTTVVKLVEQVVRGLLHDLREEEREGDHPILFP